MGNRSRELPHCCNPIRVHELHLNLGISLLALPCCLFPFLAIGQIDHERCAILSTFIKGCGADQHWDAVPVLVEVLLLKGNRCPSLFQLGQAPGVGAVPFDRRQLHPAYSPSDEVSAVISYDAQKGLVGISDLAVLFPDENSDNIGVDETPYLSL